VEIEIQCIIAVVSDAQTKGKVPVCSVVIRHIKLNS